MWSDIKRMAADDKTLLRAAGQTATAGPPAWKLS